MSNDRHYCDYALLPSGWAKNVQLVVDGDGTLVEVKQAARMDATRRIGRVVLPGMPNLHSHAFQRAMAGLAEHRSEANDSFWTWRETMYRFAGLVDPDALSAIAAQLYMELLKCGYTAVCEFHYLHHRPNGKAYDDPAAMSRAVMEAAERTGIGLSLLPALYMTGGIDGRALGERQRRFSHDVDRFERLIDDLRGHDSAQCTTGIAFHSLRAVTEDALGEILQADVASAGPIHIHIAEQLAEVDECLKARGARPVSWLLDNADVDPRWCLVHATHVTRSEVRAIVRSGAVVGLCPTTEANLGDGVFPLKTYLTEGGCYGVGSDSHISTSPIEELRWLEYGQRLAMLKRNVVARPEAPSCGDNLWHGALVGGAQACGRKIGALAPGHRADLLVLDHDAAELAGRSSAQLLDTLVFAGNRNLVKHVMVGGRWVVRDGHHRDESAIVNRYKRVVAQLAK